MDWGIGISDLNNDGWPDFYVSNDYAVPDYLYLNNQNGTFYNNLEASIGHSSHFSMGNDVVDINNDGHMDIITLDMLPEDNRRQKLLLAPDNYDKFEHNLNTGFHYQFMRNMLQLNNGNTTFSEVGQIAGISNTDWSWAALAADYDNDGWKDLFITNGYHRDYTNLDFINYMNSFVENRGRIQREDVLKIIEQMPSTDISNYMYKKSEGIDYTNVTEEWGLKHIANSNGAAYADLDNDGDLDLVVNNINKEAFIYENLSSPKHGFIQVELIGEGLNTSGVGSKVSLYTGEQSQILEQYTVRGYLSSVTPFLHFGVDDGQKIDSLIVDWPGGKRSVKYDMSINTKVTINQAQAEQKESKGLNTDSWFSEVRSPIEYSHTKVTVRDFNRQLLLPSKLSAVGPAMGKGDFNGDGLEDIFIGGGQGQAARLYFQTKNKRFVPGPGAAFEADKASVDTDVLVFDANKDGFPDIYVTSGGYHLFKQDDPALQDRVYLNDGSGNFKKAELPEILTSSSVAVNLDINGDGYDDLFIGGRVIPGKYPEAPPSYVLINDGSENFEDKTLEVSKELASIGMVTDAIATDLNGDGKSELVVVGDWMSIRVFENTGSSLSDVSDRYFDKEYRGLWNVIETGDFNKDGVPDLVVGNMGENLQFKVSDQEPGELYFDDFDQNGDIDPIFCYYIQGVSYPDLTRDELRNQIPRYKSKYTTYESFADETISDIFTQEELDNAKKLEINELKTSIFLSEKGKYRKVDLPMQAQFAPVYTINVLDYNHDGHQDLLLCGNNSSMKLRLGKADANYGMLFQGNGNGQFSYVNQLNSGLNLTGDIRKVIQIDDLFLFARNQSSVKAYQLKSRLVQ